MGDEISALRRPESSCRRPDPVGVALVGHGYAGRTFHAPLIAACAGLALGTVVTGRPKEAPGLHAVATLDEALADPAIELVVLATPNALHAPQARAALLAGKAVVIDKPFTLTAAEARDLTRLADERGLVLSVFHNRRWDADFLSLQAGIAAGRLGRIVSFESRFDRYRPEVRDRWRERDAPGGGLWYDLGPHLIDQALVLFGRPLGVTCDLAVLRPEGRAVDYAHAVLRYDGLRVVLHADMVSPAHDIRFVVQGERAAWLKSGLDVQEDQLKAGLPVGGPGWGVDPAPAILVDGASGEQAAAPGPPGDYRAFYDGVARALRSGGPPPVTGAEAVAVMEVLQAGLESSRIRAEVRLA